jgi:hypothetical protein
MYLVETLRLILHRNVRTIYRNALTRRIDNFAEADP